MPRVQLLQEWRVYDYHMMTKYAHGVGPPTEMIMNADPDDDTYSQFIAKMHDLDMAVHPWEIQDDYLKFEKTVYDETSRYINKGVDGVFVEFPHALYTLFQHFGSKANFPTTAEKTAKEELTTSDSDELKTIPTIAEPERERLEVFLDFLN